MISSCDNDDIDETGQYWEEMSPEAFTASSPDVACVLFFSESPLAIDNDDDDDDETISALLAEIRCSSWSSNDDPYNQITMIASPVYMNRIRYLYKDHFEGVEGGDGDDVER